MSKQVVTSIAQSRGENAATYIPAFKKGAQMMSGNIGALYLSGTIVSGRIAIAINHGIGVKPKHIQVSPLLTGAQGASAVAITIALAAASAATSANFYVIGTQKANAALKYSAYLQW